MAEPWAGSTGHKRTSTHAWAKLRAFVLNRDQRRCYVCGGPADQVDHVTPVWRGGTDDPANLGAICDPCHKVKTAREAAQARALQPGRLRPREAHPGLK